MLEYDTSLLGKEFDRYSYSVTKEEIVEFAQSIGETNVVYGRGVCQNHILWWPYCPRHFASSSVAMPGCLISS